MSNVVHCTDQFTCVSWAHKGKYVYSASVGTDLKRCRLFEQNYNDDGYPPKIKKQFSGFQSL